LPEKITVKGGRLRPSRQRRERRVTASRTTGRDEEGLFLHRMRPGVPDLIGAELALGASARPAGPPKAEAERRRQAAARAARHLGPQQADPAVRQ
jgi:hypothetical protein